MHVPSVTWRTGLSVFAIACWAVAAGTAGCKEYGIKAGSGPHYEFNFLDMGDQPKVKAQRGDLIGGAAFMPSPGAIPIGFDPYPFHNQPELAGARLRNPLPPGDPKAIERGKLMFERYCVPCHGAAGAGDGTVPEKGFPRPPSLMTQKLRDWTDGRVYHVISEGQNIMPSYAAQVKQEDRWAVIRYLREMQSKQAVAPPAANAAPTAPAVSVVPAAPVVPTAASSGAPASGGAAPPAGSSSAAAASSAAVPTEAPAAVPPAKRYAFPRAGVPSREE